MKTKAKGNWAERYVNGLIRYRPWVNTAAILLTAASIFFTFKLKIKSHLSELLPQDLPSVIRLNEVMERMGGSGSLLIGIESPSFDANKKFVEALATSLQEIPKEEIRYIEYRLQDTRNFFERYGLHYLNAQGLTALRDGLQNRIERGKSGAMASFLGLNDDATEASEDLTKTLTKELDPRMRRFLTFPESYIGSDGGTLLVIRILPMASSLSTADAHKLIEQVKTRIDRLNPKSFHPEMKTGLAGTLQRNLEEHETIHHDIHDTTIELIILIVGVLWLFLGSPRWIALLVMNLAVGVFWTFGVTYAAIGYLNTQTAFLGSLVVGTGINYGIILLARYVEERRNGATPLNGVITAVRYTTLGTLLASSTTAVSFVSLLVADNRGLSQFGFIGCLGIALCWVAAYAFLPLWLYDLETRWPQKKYYHPLAKVCRDKTRAFGKFLIRTTPLLTTFIVIVSALGLYGFRKLAADPMEYNYSKLQNRTSSRGGSSELNDRVQKEVYQSNLSLAFVLAETPEQARELCSAAKDKTAALPADERVLESCITLWDLLPTPRPASDKPREEKLRQEIHTLLGNRLLRFADSDVAELAGRINRNASPYPPRMKDVPYEMKRRFEEKDGTIGLIAFLTPALDKPLEDAKNLFAYTTTLGEIQLPSSGVSLGAAGDAWIIADLLETIRTDGPKISVISFIGVVLITFLLSSSLRGGFLMAGCLLIATWWQLCAQGLLGIKFNFFNFIALPITFGIGVDYPINIFLRARELGYKDYGKVLSTTGSAVFLCSLTTTIGYYTLLGASNQALTSFAELAILGEAACIATAFIALPVMMRLLGKFKQDLLG